MKYLSILLITFSSCSLKIHSNELKEGRYVNTQDNGTVEEIKITDNNVYIYSRSHHLEKYFAIGKIEYYNNKILLINDSNFKNNKFYISGRFDSTKSVIKIMVKPLEESDSMQFKISGSFKKKKLENLRNENPVIFNFKEVDTITLKYLDFVYEYINSRKYNVITFYINPGNYLISNFPKTKCFYYKGDIYINNRYGTKFRFIKE